MAIIDVHSHIIPIDLIKDEESGIKLERIDDIKSNLQVWGGITIGPLNNNIYDLELQISEMKEAGIEKRVLSIPPFLFAYNKELIWAINWSQNFNDALFEICDLNPVFLGLATIPLQNTDAAINEMVRCSKRKGFVGIEIGTNVNGVDLDNEQFSEFFQEANKIGCSILVHPNNVLSPNRFSNYYIQNFLGNPFETTIASARLILSGFFENYPNIRICFSHGGGVLPYLLGRIKHGMSVRKEYNNTRKKQLITDGIYFDCIVFCPEILNFLISMCGIERVLLGTDYPFDMQLNKPIDFIKRAVDISEQRKILEENPGQFINNKH